MKYKVIDGFRDKYTYQFHKINDVIEVSEDRAAEMKGKVVKIEEPKEKAAKPKK